MIRVGAAAFALLVLGKRCVRRAGTNSGGATHAAKEHDMLVDVGGHKLEVVSAGTKGPTVVLESGFGATSDFWEKVQHGASEFVAQELHSALHAGQFAPPNVLVGHSIGSFYIRVFANTYPREVCGMVFVDPVSEDFYEWMRTHQPEDWKQMEAASSQLPEGLRNELARKERRASPTGMASAEGPDHSDHSDETNAALLYTHDDPGVDANASRVCRKLSGNRTDCHGQEHTHGPTRPTGVGGGRHSSRS